MSTQGNRPGVGTEAIKSSAGELNNFESTAHIGHTVENQLDRILWQLILGEVELHELTPALAAWWTLAHESGRASRRAEVGHANAEADRYYAAMCRRPAPRQPNYVSHADLERIRGNHEHADRIEADNARRFAEAF